MYATRSVAWSGNLAEYKLPSLHMGVPQDCSPIHSMLVYQSYDCRIINVGVDPMYYLYVGWTELWQEKWQKRRRCGNNQSRLKEPIPMGVGKNCCLPCPPSPPLMLEPWLWGRNWCFSEPILIEIEGTGSGFRSVCQIIRSDFNFPYCLGPLWSKEFTYVLYLYLFPCLNTRGSVFIFLSSWHILPTRTWVQGDWWS